MKAVLKQFLKYNQNYERNCTIDKWSYIKYRFNFIDPEKQSNIWWDCHLNVVAAIYKSLLKYVSTLHACNHLVNCKWSQT
jgi:hypothetical protein